MSHYEVIAVLGGGVREGGLLPSWVRRRLDLAIELRADAHILTLSAGTTYRPPPLRENGFPIFESVAGAQYLLEQGVPADRILTETHSWDTVGNAYFSRTIHIDPRGWTHLLVITSDWHMPRARLAFEWVYGLAPRAGNYRIDFRQAHDPEMSESARGERWRKEQMAAESLRTKIADITTLADFHRWLFTEHDAYNATASAFTGERGKLLSAEALDSY